MRLHFPVDCLLFALYISRECLLLFNDLYVVLIQSGKAYCKRPCCLVGTQQGCFPYQQTLLHKLMMFQMLQPIRYFCTYYLMFSFPNARQQCSSVDFSFYTNLAECLSQCLLFVTMVLIHMSCPGFHLLSTVALFQSLKLLALTASVI